MKFFNMFNSRIKRLSPGARFAADPAAVGDFTFLSYKNVFIWRVNESAPATVVYSQAHGAFRRFLSDAATAGNPIPVGLPADVANAALDDYIDFELLLRELLETAVANGVVTVDFDRRVVGIGAGRWAEFLSCARCVADVAEDIRALDRRLAVELQQPTA